MYPYWRESVVSMCNQQVWSPVGLAPQKSTGVLGYPEQTLDIPVIS